MAGHGHAWFDLGHDLTEALGRGMDKGRDPISLLVRKTSDLNPVLGSEKAFVDYNIGTFGLFHKPLVWHTIPTIDEAQSVPVQAKTDGAVTNMDCRETGDFNTILVVNNGGLEKSNSCSTISPPAFGRVPARDVTSHAQASRLKAHRLVTGCSGHSASRQPREPQCLPHGRYGGD